MRLCPKGQISLDRM